MTLTEIQQEYIDRLLAAHGKITPRTKGDRFNRTRIAAYKHAVKLLKQKGYGAASIPTILKDAHDVFLLEVNATTAE